MPKVIDTKGVCDIHTANKIQKEPPKIIAPNSDELPKCPFCGGSAKAYLRSAYGLVYGVTIACQDCSCRTATIYEGKNPAGEEYTLQECVGIAVSVWSNRAQV